MHCAFKKDSGRLAFHIALDSPAWWIGCLRPDASQAKDEAVLSKAKGRNGEAR